MEAIERALAENRRALTEYEAKRLLAGYGIPVTRETVASSRADTVDAARSIGFPVVIKGSGAELMHKSEAGAVLVNILNEADVTAAFDDVSRRLGSKFEGVLVQEMIKGRRELVIGMHREPHFGPCVMLGLGGVMTEIINDTAFRVAPFDEIEALDMVSHLRAKQIFDADRKSTRLNSSHYS